MRRMLPRLPQKPAYPRYSLARSFPCGFVVADLRTASESVLRSRRWPSPPRSRLRLGSASSCRQGSRRIHPAAHRTTHKRLLPCPPSERTSHLTQDHMSETTNSSRRQYQDILPCPGLSAPIRVA